MPRKKPATAAVLPEQPLGSEEFPVFGNASAQGCVIVPENFATLKYGDADMRKLDQFAIGLLRDGTGSLSHDDVAFDRRVRDAYLRAEVMLTVRKEIAALEA